MPAYLAVLAEATNALSGVVIVSCLLLVSLLIIRLQHGDGGRSSSVVRVQHQPVQVAVQKLFVPYTLTLVPDSHGETAPGGGDETSVEVCCGARSGEGCDVLWWWGVERLPLVQLLHSTWPAYQEALAGDKPMPGCSTNRVRVPDGSHPLLLSSEGRLELGPPPRTVYPLVVVQTDPRDTDLHHSHVGSVISVLHVPDAAYPEPARIMYQYLKQRTGQLTLVTALFTQTNGVSLDTDDADDTTYTSVQRVTGDTRATSDPCQPSDELRQSDNSINSSSDSKTNSCSGNNDSSSTAAATDKQLLLSPSQEAATADHSYLEQNLLEETNTEDARPCAEGSDWDAAVCKEAPSDVHDHSLAEQIVGEKKTDADSSVGDGWASAASGETASDVHGCDTVESASNDEHLRNCGADDSGISSVTSKRKGNFSCKDNLDDAAVPQSSNDTETPPTNSVEETLSMSQTLLQHSLLDTSLRLRNLSVDTSHNDETSNMLKNDLPNLNNFSSSDESVKFPLDEMSNLNILSSTSRESSSRHETPTSSVGYDGAVCAEQTDRKAGEASEGYSLDEEDCTAAAAEDAAAQPLPLAASTAGDTDAAHRHQQQSPDECVVCQESPVSLALLPCRHVCVCRPCFLQLMAAQQTCPLCRTHVAAYFVV